MTATSPPLRRQIPRLALLAIGLMVILVGLHILYMVVYGHLINPGQPAEHYPAHALASGPWFSTIVGAALFFYAGRRLTRRDRSNGLRGGLVPVDRRGDAHQVPGRRRRRAIEGSGVAGVRIAALAFCY